MAETFEMVAEHLDDDQQRHRHQRADKSPQPGPEGDGDEDRHGIDLQPPADHHRRHELAFDDVAQNTKAGASSAKEMLSKLISAMTLTSTMVISAPT